MIAALLVGIAVNFITGFVTWAVMRSKQRRTIVPVEIKPRKIEGAELARTKPEVLVATFSGCRCPREMTEDQFRSALKNADLSSLPLDEGTLGIGHTIRILKTYPTLKEVFLIGTESSVEAVGLLRKYLSANDILPGCKIFAQAEHTVHGVEDTQMVEEAFRITRAIFEGLREQKRYQPTKSRILVDVTGGVRGMSIGALLACVRPDQDIHVIGSKYDAAGNIKGSFPMVISFEVRT